MRAAPSRMPRLQSFTQLYAMHEMQSTMPGECAILSSMEQRSPTVEGFRLMFGHPAFGLAEITWRWSFGFAAFLLGTFSFFAFLDTLPVTRGDALLFRSRHPVLIAKALARILHGSGGRASATFLILAVCLSVAWVVVCGLGRAATMRAIFAHFRSLTALGVAREEVATFSASSLFGLNFFRVIALLAACAAGFAPLAMAHWVRSDDPSLVFVLFMAVAILIFAAWSAVNWFLSAAVLFVVGDGENTFGAMAATIDLCRNRPGPISAIGAWFGLAHLGAFAIATFAAMLSVGTLGVLPVRLVVLGMISVSLVYFAVADFLYIGRMAAYAAVVEMPNWPVREATPAGSSLPPSHSPAVEPASIECIDPDELILSDVPPLA